MRFLTFASFAIALSCIGLSHSRVMADPPEEEPWKRFLTGEHAQQVKELEAKVHELVDAGRYAEALDPARRAHAIRSREQGATHWQTLSAKNNVDTCHNIAALPKDAQVALTEANRLAKQERARLMHDGRYLEAIPVSERILAIRRRYLDKDSSMVAKAINELGIACHEAGQYARAVSLFRETLEINIKNYGDAHPNIAAAYGNLAISLEQQDMYQEGREAKEKALRIQLRAYGEESESVAIAHNNLASSCENLGRYEDAVTGYRKSLAILQRLSGDEMEARIATAHGNLAGVLNKQAKFTEAEEEYQKSLTIRLRLFGEDHPETARTYNNHGVCLASQGKYADAELLYRKALAIYSRVLGDDHPLTLKTYSNLAVALDAQARFTKAELLLRRILRLQASGAGVSNTSTAIWNLNLAHNLQAQRRYAEANVLIESAVATLREVLTDDHPDTVGAKTDLATNLTAQKQYVEGEKLFRSAVKSLQQRLGDKHPSVAQAYGNLGGNLYFQGRYDEAESIHHEVLASCLRNLGPHHPTTAWSYKNLVIDLWAHGRYAEVEKLSSAVAESLEGARRRVGFSGLERTAFAAENSTLPLLAAVAARRGHSTEAWQFLETHLARGLLDDLSAHKWTETERERHLTLCRQVEQLDSQITALVGAPVLTSDARLQIAELTRQRDGKQNELAEFQKKLARTYGAPAGDVYELTRIQAALPEDGALVTWLDYAGQPKGHDPNGEHWVCVIRHTGRPVWVSLTRTEPGAAWTEAADQLATKFREECSQRPMTTNTGKETARKLYAQRLKPVEKELEGVRRLVVLPSLHMQGIPVEALVEEVHPGRYIVSYAPSGSVFAWLHGKRAAPVPDQRLDNPSILAVGDPVFAPARSPTELPPPPDRGALITVVTPNSTAANAGLRPGDVLLKYGDASLDSAADLESAIDKASAQDPRTPIPVRIWRDGVELERNVAPAPLGGMVSKTPAAKAIRVQRELDQLMRRSSATGFNRLQGAEREVQAVIGAFRNATILKGSDASEENLRRLAAENRLAQFNFLHFATHGQLDQNSPMQSALILSQGDGPEMAHPGSVVRPKYGGRLTAEQILRGWRLNAELVTLSACETGLGMFADGEGYLGFSQALFLAGARSLVVSLWNVDDASTALLMTRFYENLLARRPGLKERMPKAQALAEAKTWLRGLTADEAEQVGGGLIRGVDTDTARGKVRAQQKKQAASTGTLHPYAHPYYWAAFVLVGDPG